MLASQNFAFNQPELQVHDTESGDPIGADQMGSELELNVMEFGAVNHWIAGAQTRTTNFVHSIESGSQFKGTVLIVEDEPSIGLSLRYILSEFRVAVIQTNRCEEALHVLRKAHFDAALLNLNRPGVHGAEVCWGIRKRLPSLPIVMLAATNDENQALEAFGAGVDDYITKPFRQLDLIARLDAAIRRGRLCHGCARVITVGDVTLDSSRRRATKNGRRIHLTPTEFKLLHLLMANCGRALSHARLLINVWGPEYGSEREYLRTYVRQLRVKIEDEPAKPSYLLTESHFGYRFSEQG